VVEESAALHGDLVRAGDVLIGYASNGLHTNGYTPGEAHRVRSPAADVQGPVPDTGPHGGPGVAGRPHELRPPPSRLLPRLHALAQSRAAGIPGNLVRVLPAGCESRGRCARVVVAPVFRVLMRAGEVSLGEMRRVFNRASG